MNSNCNEPKFYPVAMREEFLSLSFDLFTIEETVDILMQWIHGPSSSFRYVVTPNVTHVVRASQEPILLRPLYDSATLCLCDSRILALGARKVLDLTIPVVPGSDLTVFLLSKLSDSGAKVAIIGSTAFDVERLREAYPNLELVHHDAPAGLRHSKSARSACVKFLDIERPQITFIAVGMPQQEMIAYEASKLSNLTGVAVCVGASIDFIVGRQRRAPKWMQRACIEWLYRILGDPKRFAKRYAFDLIPFFILMWRARKKYKDLKLGS